MCEIEMSFKVLFKPTKIEVFQFLFSYQMYSGKISAASRREKYIKTELNVKRSSLSIRKIPP